MPTNPRRKSDAARRANQIIRSRTVLVMLLLGVVTFLLLFWKLYDLQIVRHEEMQGKAVNQQTREVVVTASRGSILDRDGNVLAVSATAESLYISPKDIAAYVESQEKSIAEAAVKAAEKGQSYTAPEVRDQKYIARGLSRITGVDQAKIEGRMEEVNNQYVEVKKKMEQAMADEVRRFINGEIDEEGNELITVNEKGEKVLKTNPKKGPSKLQGVWLNPDSKRYYPYSSLAANVVGFVNSENQGGVGLEAKYNSALEGTAGLTVSAKDNAGNDMLYQYEQYYDAQDGQNLVLTIDVEVQSYLEKGIESMLEKFDAANGATGIVMDVNSGAILGMASYPNYDANQYGMILDPALQTKLDAKLEEIEKNRSSYESEESYEAAVAAAKSNAVNTSWRNKCIDSTYEPGSTFKPITLAAALEEGLVNLNTTFNCTGSVKVGKWTIHCSKKAGHGIQDLKTATGNSCNPAFINMGQRIGGETYYEYLEAFGLTEPTHVDMIGETKGIISRTNLVNDAASLASYAFGQTFNVTPIALIRAQAACVNGGYLYTPYVVEQVVDGEGNLISQHDATPVRQVISEESSARVRECLEYVVASGTGKNGRVAGYRIGGKTGTADKTETRYTTKEVIVSFMCFAPADDPQYIMLLTMDTPSRNTGVYVSGGNMVAPTASSIMADILPALGVEPDYTEEELAAMDAAVPNVVGQVLDGAKMKLDAAHFACRTVGSGTTVTDQVPAGGAIVPNNATVVLYLGEEKPDALCTVPNVVGLTAAQANQVMTNAGLILKMSGTISGSGNIHAISQNTVPGTQLEAGSIVEVHFGDSTVLD